MHIVNTIHHTLDYVGGVFLDKVTGKCYTYTYDTYENVTEEKVDGVAFKSYEYDEHNRLEKTTVSVGNGTHVYRPIYDTRADGKIYADNAVVGVTLDGKFTARAEHDNLGRVTRKSIKLNGATSALIAEELAYLTTAEGTNTRLTNMVESFANKVNGVEVDKLTYVYDNNGNITEIKRDGEVLIQYAYDGLNQLIREDNAILGTICTYTYDTAGNIIEKKVYNRTALGVGVLEQTIPYTYATTGWKDRLVSYNGQAITYDALGNPTTYRGHSLTWGKIKQLESYDTNTFAYNAEGIRVRKNNITYELDGNQILREVRGANVIEYFYGSNGVAGFTYNGSQYYYQKNLLGDITAIYSASGIKVAEYVYDAWGKCTVVLDTDGIGTLNSYRYRGYYYDIETGLYYLNARYYDPEVDRWISPEPNIERCEFDDGAGVLQNNVYTYCANNPITFKDDSGESITITICGITLGVKGLIALGALIVSAATVITYAVDPQFRAAWDNMIVSALVDFQNGISAILGATSAFTSWAVSQANILSQSIADSFAKVKEKPKYRSDNELHHIVAQRSPKACLARKILKEVGIGINSSINLISLKTGLHRRLHTDFYFAWVNTIIYTAYTVANGDKEKQRKNVEIALNSIRMLLTNMNSKAPF